MLSRERVITVIEHGKPDRIPIYGWVSANLSEPISERWGSVAAFEDRYEFDFAHLFGGPQPYRGEDLNALRVAVGGPITPADLLDIELADPDDQSTYADVVAAVDHHKQQRGRFVYMQRALRDREPPDLSRPVPG